MAVTVLTTDMAGGVNYTHTTDSFVDWLLVPSDTYFYDLAERIVYYKDALGAVIGAYESSSGTVTSIDATISGTAITISGVPITTNGTIAFGYSGAATDYIDGAGDFQPFPTIPVLPANIVETVTTTDGSFIDLTPNAPVDGAVTVTADLSATGTPDATTFLRGDNTWVTPPVGIGDLVSTNNLSDVANAVTSLSNLGGEPAFSKNTAFNKDFGTTAGTVLEGDKNADIVLNTAKVGITPTQASDITTNNAKVTNATHTGEVTGGGALTVDSTAISNKTLITAASGMEVLVNDAGTLKKTNASDFLGVFTPTINSVTMKEVSVEADFGTAVSGVITLAGNTTYFIRGEVNCNNRLLIPNAGTAIIGWNRDEDSLNFTGLPGVSDFITVTEQSLEIANIKLSSTNNTGGTVLLRAVNYNQPDYNEGRDKVLTIINCQIRNCFDVWHIEGFDLVDIQNTLVWYVQATTIGCHFKNVSKLQISSCEYVRWFDETSLPTPSGYATTPMVELVDNGGGSGFGAINISGCVIHPQQTQDGINISDLATIGFGTIASNTGIDIGLTTGVVANFDYDIQNSTIVQANQGIQNGNAKGVLSLTDNIVLLNTSSQPIVGGLYSLPIADASFVGGVGPTNPITFPVAQRVITSSTNGSFTYDSKIDGNFSVNLNATVGVNSNGTFNIQVQFRQNGTPLPLIGKTTIRNSGGTFIAQPIGLSIQGTATQGDVFDVLISIDSADDVLVSELIVNGYQF